MVPRPDGEAPVPHPKTVHLWSKPIDAADEPSATTSPDGLSDGPKHPNHRPSFSEAVATIKKEDFASVATAPCARQGFLTGIAAGAGFGGLKFILKGNAAKASNWAAGAFVLASVASYEYCQFLRRKERIQMKRQIEIINENRREQARKAASETEERQSQDGARKSAQRPWYKFW